MISRARCAEFANGYTLRARHADQHRFRGGDYPLRTDSHQVAQEYESSFG